MAKTGPLIAALTYSEKLIISKPPAKVSLYQYLWRGLSTAKVWRQMNGATLPTKTRWQNALLKYSMTPADYLNDVVEYNDTVVVIRDRYPKAKHHFLVLPRGKQITMWQELKYCPENVLLLKKMQEKGHQMARSHSSHVFRIGFHCVPSMWQLHMHVISQDFDSVKLKHKKHWNSFTTSFFVDVEQLIARFVEQKGVVFDVDTSEQLLKSEMACPRCNVKIVPLSALKEHTKSCASDLAIDRQEL